MRKLLSVSLLFSMAMPAFAEVGVVPEPETLSLLGLGAVALLLARRGK